MATSIETFETVTRLYDDGADAVRSVDEIVAAGIPREAVSQIWGKTEGKKVPVETQNNEIDAEAGAGIGAILGGGVGLVAGLGLIAIPGVGPVLGVGWLVATVVGALGGAGVGAATGGFVGSLTEAGIAPEDANVYAEAVRRGGTLISVRVPTARRLEVETILGRYHPVDPQVRGDYLRDQGWTAFDEKGGGYDPGLHPIGGIPMNAAIVP
jgi:hypothetical protein